MAISRNILYIKHYRHRYMENVFTFGIVERIPLKNLWFVSAFLVIPRPILLIAADNGRRCLESTPYDRSRNREAAIVSAGDVVGRQSCYRHTGARANIQHVRLTHEIFM